MERVVFFSTIEEKRHWACNLMVEWPLDKRYMVVRLHPGPVSTPAFPIPI